MGAVASATIAAAMFFFMLSAAGAVKDTFQNHREQIEAIPIDEEVREADALARKRNAAYTEAVAWENVPVWAKFCLVLAVLCSIGYCYLLAGFNTQCFAEYDLMYTISEHLGGKWYNLVRPLGRYALILTVAAFVFLKAFQFWAVVSHRRIFLVSGTSSWHYSLTVRVVQMIQREAETIMKETGSGEAKPLTDTEAPRYT